MDMYKVTFKSIPGELDWECTFSVWANTKLEAENKARQIVKLVADDNKPLDMLVNVREYSIRRNDE